MFLLFFSLFSKGFFLFFCQLFQCFFLNLTLRLGSRNLRLSVRSIICIRSQNCFEFMATLNRLIHVCAYFRIHLYSCRYMSYFSLLRPFNHIGIFEKFQGFYRLLPIFLDLWCHIIMVRGQSLLFLWCLHHIFLRRCLYGTITSEIV